MSLTPVNTSQPDGGAAAPKKRILIIDDEVGFTRMVRRALESTGQFEVQEENNSFEALSTVRKFKPDLILLDVIMPVFDGGEIAARLRTHPTLRSIPVIFLTATVASSESGRRGLSSGGNLFLSKPVDLNSLIQHINDLLSPKT